MTYMLDTNTIIYAIKGMYGIAERIIEQGESKNQIHISSIVVAELEVNIVKTKSSQKKSALEKVLTPFVIKDFSFNDAKHYAEIRAYLEGSGRPIGDMDMLIAAHARSSKCTLVTHNTKHFSRIPKLSLEDWVS